MKFRIYRKGLWIIPQFSINENEWLFFHKEKIINNESLLMGIKSFMNCFGKNVRHIDNLFQKIENKEILVFDDLLTTYTFLGAASYFHSKEKIDFNIKIEKDGI